MTRYKPGSRVQQMWEIWQAKGTEAATSHGPSLNLAAGTIKQWCRMWEKEKDGGGASSPPSPRKAKDGSAPKLPKRIAGYKFNPTGKRRVRCTYLPGRIGYLISAGAEVSEVRWDDDFGETNIINRFLEDADA